MKEIKFECEVITRMFLAGADGKTPELRTPSIKGAMRFCWRAMNEHLSIDKLREKEAEIFGGSGDKERKSKVGVRVDSTDIKISETLWKEIEYEERTAKSGKKYKIPKNENGVAYLLYSTFMLTQRPYIEAGSKFKIILSSFDLNSLQHAIASFWTLSFFGGLGARSRRGGGNFVITQIEDKENILQKIGLEFIKKDSNNFSNWLIENYKKAFNVINSKGKSDFIFAYSNLSFSRFIVSKEPFNSWKDALNEIGKIYQDFRTDNKSDIFGTSAFGLPRKHVQTSDSKNYKRRSSPLIIKVVKIGDNYHWFLIRLAGEFLPEGIVLQEKAKRNGKDKNNEIKKEKPEYSVLDDFWNKIKKDNSEYILFQPDKLEDIKEEIKKSFNPSQIILFGSKARGDFHEKSDIDIAVKGGEMPIAGDEVVGNIDIVNMEKIDSKFKEKINKEGVVVCQKD